MADELKFPAQIQSYVTDFASEAHTKKPTRTDLLLPADQQWQCTTYDYKDVMTQFHLRFTPGASQSMPLFMSTDLTPASPAFTVLNSAKKLVPAYAHVMTSADSLVWYSKKLGDDPNSATMLIRGLQTATTAAPAEIVPAAAAAAEEGTATPEAAAPVEGAPAEAEAVEPKQQQIFLEFLQPFDASFPVYAGETSTFYTDTVDDASRPWVVRGAGSCYPVPIPPSK
ncbi:MAG: hypothetical protein ABII18_12085 [bacterium]